MSETDQLLNLAERLAREAGALQRERYEQRLAIDTKTSPTDLVTEVDHACEALIVETLARERPADGVLAEEGRGGGNEGAAWRWIVDPLDGTVNYAHGYPRFCVSIGVTLEGRRELGVVYDPLLDELFHAVRGRGAWLNGRPLRVSRETELSRSLVATGFGYDVKRSSDNVAQFSAFVAAARGIRRDGSAALDLCYVAAGRLDGFWELRLNPWDVAAGALVVEEAGGRASDLAGRPLPTDVGPLVSSNGLIHDAMLGLLSR